MPTISYPLDATGLATSNKIVNEPHVLTEINSTTYRIIIPEFAPFYLDNFVLKHIDALGVVTTLVADVDYYLCLPYIGGTRSIGKMLYGGITINTTFVNGSITVDYQTLGGDWIADANYVLNRLAEMVYNPRTTVWDIVTNKPNAFPPINHDQSADYIFGYQDLIAAVNSLAAIIANGPNPALSAIQHLTNTNNPHNVTREQLGLGNVTNLMLATDAEVAAHLPLNKYVTLKQVLSLLNP